MQNCVFVDEAGFDINMRSSYGGFLSDAQAIAEMSFTRAVSHTVLGTISTERVVYIEVRVLLNQKDKK